jgi:hypothetical protein
LHAVIAAKFGCTRRNRLRLSSLQAARAVVENPEDLTADEVAEQFDVTREQVTAVLEFVAESPRSEVPAGARPL